MRSMDTPCTFKELSVDQEEYPKAAQMAFEIYVWSTGSDPKSLYFALTQSFSTWIQKKSSYSTT